MKSLIADIDLRALEPERLLSFIAPSADTLYSACADGLRLTAARTSRDPHVLLRAASLFASTGALPAPVDASALAALVFRILPPAPGYFEIYYTAGDVTEPTAWHSSGEDYFGGSGWEYVTVDLTAKPGTWQGPVHDTFRVDWSNWVPEGDELIISDIFLFGDAKEAHAYAAEGNRDRKPFRPSVQLEPEKGEPGAAPGYYVCLRDKHLVSGGEKNILARFDDLDEAVRLCEENKVYGYRVADGTGRVVWTPYTLLQCDLLREGKYVTDYVRENGFLYGDAPINPGIDCRAKLVSCDRLVCWVLYRLGFVDQPFTQGVVVSAFPAWCRANGFTLLTDYEALEPGDVMLVRPHAKGFPQHAFLFAGYADKPENEPDFPAMVADPNAPAGPAVKEMYAYRYDCGSNARIQSVQPSHESLFRGAYTPVELFRPVATEENCVNWKRYQ